MEVGQRVPPPAVTVRVKVVAVVEAPRGEPVTLIVDEPMGVVEEVEIVSVLEQVGLQGLLVIDWTLAPEGKPEAESVTAAVVPADKVLVTVLEPDEPWVTVTGPELERE